MVRELNGVDDDGGAHERLPQADVITRVGLDQPDPPAPGIAVGMAGRHDDLVVAGLQQALHDLPADEAGAPRHHDAHAHTLYVGGARDVHPRRVE